MNYLLDTNIIILYSRDSDISKRIEDKYQLFDESNTLAVSVVTLGEIDAFIKKLDIGDKKRQKMNKLLNQVAKVKLNSKPIIERYGTIDAYSQGKLEGKPSNFTARNMGKNDIWIAATASVYNLTLVTTDKDFGHLKDEFVNLELVDIEMYKQL